uniref:Uncharacterized protein n=1 Tax=Fungal sp. (strain NRRL 50135) TaxID=1547289 RepID=A0A089FS89_FUNXX|nr:hypothetical protein gNR589 [fungal sp. NRRL 50135]
MRAPKGDKLRYNYYTTREVSCYKLLRSKDTVPASTISAYLRHSARIVDRDLCTTEAAPLRRISLGRNWFGHEHSNTCTPGANGSARPRPVYRKKNIGLEEAHRINVDNEEVGAITLPRSIVNALERGVTILDYLSDQAGKTLTEARRGLKEEFPQSCLSAKEIMPIQQGIIDTVNHLRRTS